MNREDLLDLCTHYVSRRQLEPAEPMMPPVLQIIDSYLHAEISESEKNSLMAYVRGPDYDAEDDGEVATLEELALADDWD